MNLPSLTDYLPSLYPGESPAILWSGDLPKVFHVGRHVIFYEVVHAANHDCYRLKLWTDVDGERICSLGRIDAMALLAGPAKEVIAHVAAQAVAALEREISLHPFRRAHARAAEILTEMCHA